MEAAVLEAVNRLVVKDVPRPVPGELLIKVGVCGICGPDVNLLTGKYTARCPVILGHEFAGEVVDVGAGVA